MIFIRKFGFARLRIGVGQLLLVIEPMQFALLAISNELVLFFEITDDLAVVNLLIGLFLDLLLGHFFYL